MGESLPHATITTSPSAGGPGRETTVVDPKAKNVV